MNAIAEMVKDIQAQLQRELAARITAQIESEALKARIVSSGAAERRAVREAVLKEREACAMVCEGRQTPGTASVAILSGAADAIRARGAT